MAFFRGGWSFLCGRILKCSTSPTIRQISTRKQGLKQEEYRRKGREIENLFHRLKLTVNGRSLDSVWAQIEEERNTDIKVNGITFHKLSSHWRAQMMNKLSVSPWDIVPRVSNYALGKSLYEHCLQNCDLDRFQKLLICISYLSLCTKHDLKAEKEKLILDTYEKILQMAVVLDSTSTKIVLQALSSTRQWRQCKDIIEKIETQQLFDLKTFHVSPYIKAALKNGETSLAFSLLDQLDEKCLYPNDDIFTAIIGTNNEKVVEKFLRICHEKKWIPTKDSACKLMDWFEKYGIGSSFVYKQRPLVPRV